MRDNLAEIVCVIDKSGSMSTRAQDTIGGFNKFLEDQQKVPGEALFSMTLFDTEYQILYSGVPIRNVKPLDEHSYVPGGLTALLDAVGKTIDSVGERLKNIPEQDRPGKILFCIITDGEENSSKEYKLDQVSQKIKNQQEAYKWEFLFLGANIDSFLAARSFNIPLTNAMNFAPTSRGVAQAYSSISMSATNYRTGGKADLQGGDNA